MRTVLDANSIYSAERFTGINLPLEALLLQGLNPTGWDLIRYNRLLFEAAYPTELAKSPSAPSGRYRHASAYDARRHAVVIMGGLYSSKLAGNETWELLPPDELTINEQPASQYRQPGDTATFNVLVRGPAGAPLAYQWYFDDHPLEEDTFPERTQQACSSRLLVRPMPASIASRSARIWAGLRVARPSSRSLRSCRSLPSNRCSG